MSDVAPETSATETNANRPNYRISKTAGILGGPAAIHSLIKALNCRKGCIWRR
jgi:hypothetical protein